MRIIRLFREHMQETAPAQPGHAEFVRLQRSLRRRDRRIAHLKRKLRATRDTKSTELHEAREIIAGLEQALLLHTPRAHRDGGQRIAELEARLAAMTHLADSLQQRASL